MIRLYNLKTLNIYDDVELKDNEIIIDGKEIVYVGTDTSSFDYDESYDLKGNVVMSGFKNVHTHSAMTFLRSRADDMPLLDWLHNQVFPYEDALTAEDTSKFNKLGILEYLSSGITLCFDMYMFSEQMVEDSIEMGFRTALCGVVTSGEENLARAEKRYKEINGYHELVEYFLGFHAEYTISPENYKGLGELSKKLKAPVFHHSSESRQEVENCIKNYGMTAVERSNYYGIFDNGGGIFHGVHLSENDKKILKDNDIYVVTNPSSNCKLASGIADLQGLDEYGIKLAIGTDGPASNNSLNMFKEMYLASVLQKIKHDSASAMDATKILKMAISGGARMLGYDKLCAVESGSIADLVVIDMNKPNMQPVNNVAKNIVYSGDNNNIYMTIINGKVLYKNGEYLECDAEKIIYDANKAKEALIKRVDG